MTTFITATEARKQFYSLIEKAKVPGFPFVITHDGTPAVVCMSFDEFEGWMETMEIMADPEFAADLKQGIQEMEDGDVISLEELKKELNL